MVPIEQHSYTGHGFDLDTVLRPRWTPKKIAKLGADGVKLYLSYRADVADVAAEQRKLVAELVAACRTEQLPLIVERSGTCCRGRIRPTRRCGTESRRS